MFFMSERNISTYILLVSICFLQACADRGRPAPVVSLGNSIPVKKSEKNTLKTTTHKVKLGETLYSIAWRSGKDVRTIAALNNISAPYNIYPDQVLQLVVKSKKNRSTTAVAKVSNVKTVEIKQKYSKKDVAKVKTPEYGEKSDGKTTNVKVPSLTQKVDHWIWPVKGKIISRFSASAKGNKGIDIAGNKGQPIKAAAKGLVVYAGNALRGYGNLIIIKHNDDYLSAYAHNDELLIKEQQIIKAGQVIATMGNSGTNQNKLHFEIRFRGKSVNPTRYLPK